MIKSGSLAIITAFCCLALFSACGRGGTRIHLERENAVLNSDGKTLTVELTGTPSTGYEWTCESGDEKLLKQTEHSTKDTAESSSEPLVGTDVIEYYTFEAAGSGETMLTAKYARSWEETPDDIEYVYRVSVRDGKITMASIEGEPTIDEIMGETLSE